MFKSIGFAKNGLIVGAIVLGLTGIGLLAPAAHAAPNQTEGTKKCWLKVGPPVNAEIGYDPGSEITTVSPTGTVRKYRCNGTTGEWEELPAALTSVLSRGAFASASVTLISATPVLNSGTTTFKSTTTALAR